MTLKLSPPFESIGPPHMLKADATKLLSAPYMWHLQTLTMCLNVKCPIMVAFFFQGERIETSMAEILTPLQFTSKDI